MRRQLEGSRAVAETVALARPQVIAAYPISPQTHIVERLSALVKADELASCEFVNVESEFSALSVCIGASATGARTYTATASQGLLFMAEAVFNAAGLGLPIVMTIANRAIGAPINIWNDHSDVMAMRDCGWVQLHAGSNQDAADLHLLAFRLAEAVSVPVMVCMDGFVLTHASEPIDVPTAAQADALLPPFAPRQRLDPADPVTIGAMVGPEAFTEVRYLAHLKQLEALDRLPALADAQAAVLGRRAGGPLRPYRCDDAELVVVTLGSVVGPVQDAVDALREHGERVGALEIVCHRPWPRDAVRDALDGVRRVVVVERAFTAGVGGIVGQDVRLALGAEPADVLDVIAGLGGRPVTASALAGVIADALEDRLDPLTFLGLRADLVERELAR